MEAIDVKMLFCETVPSFPSFFGDRNEKKSIIGLSKHSKTYVFFWKLEHEAIFEAFFEHYYKILKKIFSILFRW